MSEEKICKINTRLTTKRVKKFKEILLANFFPYKIIFAKYPLSDLPNMKRYWFVRTIQSRHYVVYIKDCKDLRRFKIIE